MKRILVGSRTPSGELRVWLDGERLDPRRSQKLWNHSPDGFNAGYGGSGPAQLALAVLLACGFTDEEAIRYHQRFKFDHVVTLQGDEWTHEFDAEAWHASHLPPVKSSEKRQ
jgi:hypothetical protein